MAVEERNRALLDWYREHRRDLPWRGRSDPWAILVAEIMLQQTQVGRVVERYTDFLQAFPTPESLASAPLAEALIYWRGLGYPRRVARLREAAAIISTDGWPQNHRQLEGLPGVGPYTAAAVACFAFGAEVPAVDTNLRRVLSRWTGETLTGARLLDRAVALLDRNAPAAWNQALMDLGATICRPRPRCDECPVATWCADPAIYQPPPRQPRYRGSRREARGRVLAVLLTEILDTDELVARTGLDRTRVEEALTSLVADGLVGPVAGGFAPVGGISR